MENVNFLSKSIKITFLPMHTHRTQHHIHHSARMVTPYTAIQSVIKLSPAAVAIWYLRSSQEDIDRSNRMKLKLSMRMTYPIRSRDFHADYRFSHTFFSIWVIDSFLWRYVIWLQVKFACGLCRKTVEVRAPFGSARHAYRAGDNFSTDGGV